MGTRVAARGLAPWYPKRSRAAWREGAPEWVCDVFDHPREDDRYTVFLTGDGWIGQLDPRVPFIGCDAHAREVWEHVSGKLRVSDRSAAWAHSTARPYHITRFDGLMWRRLPGRPRLFATPEAAMRVAVKWMPT